MKTMFKGLVSALVLLGGLSAGAASLNKEGIYTTTVTVNRGEEHTFWVTGLTDESAVSWLEVSCEYTYKDEDGETQEDFVFASESTEVENQNGGSDMYVLLTAEDWEWVPVSKKSLKFTVTVEGFYDDEVSANNNFTFGHAKGRDQYPGESVPVAPKGTEGNPESVAVKMLTANDGSAGTLEGEFLDDHGGTYHIRTGNLVAGQKYRFGLYVVSGTNVTFKMSKMGSDGNLFESAKEYAGFEECGLAYELVIDQSGVYEFVIDGCGTGDTFTFYHAGLPKLTPVQHESTDLSVGGVSPAFRPGYMNDPYGYAYDEVIDQHLFKISGYKKGENFIFRTEEADAALLMRLYDAKGNVLAENKYVAEGDCNVAVAWTATANYSTANAVYVGVCQQLGEGEEPTAGEVTLVAEKVELDNSVSVLTAVPDTQERSPADADGVIASEERTLSATNWVNTFVLAARAGVTYRVKATTSVSNGLAVTSRVYTLSGTRETELTDKGQGLSGSLDPNAERWLEFTPSAHGNVYVEVSVAGNDAAWLDGKGLSYGPLTLCATAGGDYGILQAEMKGAPESEMGWKILSGPGIVATKEVFYASGTGAIVPAGEYALVAKEVKDFVKPDAKNGYCKVTVVAGTTPSEAEIYKYIDTVDPLDDEPNSKIKHPTLNKAYAPAKLAPTAAKPAEAKRSLWTDDPADWFTFTGAEGSYYAFGFAEKGGAPKISVYGPDGWTNECEYVLKRDQLEAVQISAKAKGTYYVKVAHADETAPEDSSYVLKASMATPGAIKLAKSAISVKEDAAYVDVSVSRTGKDGKVRAKFRTEAAEAQPGKEYYPTNGVLEWLDGDNKAKTVRVRLIPDLVAAWESDKTFKVVFETFSEDEGLADGEFIPAFTADTKTKLPVDTAVITLTEVSKKVPGTIQMAGAANPKKPVIDVTAKDGELVIPLERVDGSDGVVAVKVETAKGTANKSGEVDYEDKAGTNAVTIVWEDGDTGKKNFTVKLKASSDWTAQKSFTVKLTAVKSGRTDAVQYETPKFAAASITVNINNDKFMKTMAAYAKELPKAGGVAVKEAKAGTMFVGDDGSLVSPDGYGCSFTLAGPGRFTVKPSVGLTASTGTGKTAQTAVCDAGVETSVYVASGSQTVKFEAPAGSGEWRFLPLSGGAPYLWEPLSETVAAAPTLDKAVVLQGTNELCFVREEGVSYRVYALSSGAKNAANKAMKLGDAETEIVADGSGRFMLDCVYEDKGNKGKYTWRVDSYFEGGSVTNVSKKVWNLTVAAEGAKTTCVKGMDVWGVEFSTESGTNVVLRQCVKALFEVADETATAVKTVAGKFPDGLKLAQDKVTKKWLLSGTSTKAGVYDALIQATYKDDKNKAVAGATVAMRFTVEAAPTAIGTFNGLAVTHDTLDNLPSLAQVSITAGSNGKLSAKVNIGGKSYTFADTGYSYVTGVPDDPETPVEVTAELVQIQKVTVERVNYVYTNLLYYTVRVAEETDPDAWYSVGELRIEMAALPDAKGSGFQSDVWYSGKVCRDNSKSKEWQAEAAKFAGYYTVALVPEYAAEGEPCGNGYLTLTLDAKGKAKVAGALADGTKYSASSSASLWRLGFDPSVRIPLYACKSPSVFGGWLAIRFPEDGEPVAAIEHPDTDLVWKNDDAASTFTGEYGFSLDLVAVGGYYDTVFNLQRHYLEYDFEVDAPADEDLEFLEECLGEGYGFVAEASPNGEKVDVAGDTVSAEKQQLVKDSAKKYNDWAASVNPSGVKINFKRATGIVDGTCSLWYEGENAKGVKEQKSFANLKHAGVLLLNRDESNGYISDDVWTAGSVVVPMTVGKRKWNGCFRFNIRTVKVDGREEDGSAWDEVEAGHEYPVPEEE